MQVHVLVDGLGWNIAVDHPDFQFLGGDRGPLDTILGFSSSAIPTILTGRMPQEHGVWNLFQLKEEGGDFPLFRAMGPFAPLLDRSRIARRIVLEANRLVTGFRGYYQTYRVPSALLGRLAISERENLYQPGGTGRSPSVFDRWQERGDRWISASWRDGAKTDDEVIALACRKIEAENPDRVFVYLAGFDAWGHRHANDRDAMMRESGRIANLLQRFLSWCRAHRPDTQMDVFSDHGMVPLAGTVDLGALLGRGMRDHYGSAPWTVLLDATMARFWWHEPGASERARHLLADAPGHFLSMEEIRRHAIALPECYGQDIWLADPGIQIVPSHMSPVPLPGMHGFAPDHPDMLASFLSTRRRSRVPKAIWEIFPTFLPDQPESRNTVARAVRSESTRTGLDRNPSMPAFSHASLSDGKALAVRAMIGTLDP